MTERTDCWASNLSGDGVERGPCSEGGAVIVDEFYDPDQDGQEGYDGPDFVTACPAHEDLYYKERPFSLLPRLKEETDGQDPGNPQPSQ